MNNPDPITLAGRLTAASLMAILGLVFVSESLAVPIQAVGSRSAVSRVDRAARFDFIVSRMSLDGYTENGLRISTPGTSHIGGSVPGMVGAYFYAPNSWYTSISTTDGLKLTALELNAADCGEQSILSETCVMNVYWEIYANEVLTGSGSISAPAGTVMSFSDTDGFDELRIAAYYYLADADSFAPGLTNIESGKRQNGNRLHIDNVVASVSADVDHDGILDDFDNCPDSANSDQEDRDMDRIGDLCDPFPNGGSALAFCEEELEVSLSTGIPDDDADGEPDVSDGCPGSAVGAAVDGNGCSLEQFCNLVDAATIRGSWVCKRSDWRNDEPQMKRQNRDCAVDKGLKGRGDDRCVPATQ